MHKSKKAALLNNLFLFTMMTSGFQDRDSVHDTTGHKGFAAGHHDKKLVKRRKRNKMARASRKRNQ
jgi:hypothetical protein